MNIPTGAPLIVSRRHHLTPEEEEQFRDIDIATIDGDISLVKQELEKVSKFVLDSNSYYVLQNIDFLEFSDISPSDKNNFTLLHVARIRNYPEILQLFLNCIDAASNSPFSKVSQRAIALLNQQDSRDRLTALFHLDEHMQILRKSIDYINYEGVERARRCTEMLLQAGIDIHLKNVHGKTAFHQMIAYCDLPGTQLILEHVNATAKKADVVVRSNLLKFIHSDCVNIILDYHISKECEEFVNTPDDIGYSPLCIALNTHIHFVNKGRLIPKKYFRDVLESENLVKLLLEYVASVTAPFRKDNGEDHPGIPAPSIFDIVQEPGDPRDITKRVIELFEEHRPPAPPQPPPPPPPPPPPQVLSIPKSTPPSPSCPIL